MHCTALFKPYFSTIFLVTAHHRAVRPTNKVQLLAEANPVGYRGWVGCQPHCKLTNKKIYWAFYCCFWVYLLLLLNNPYYIHMFFPLVSIQCGCLLVSCLIGQLSHWSVVPLVSCLIGQLSFGQLSLGQWAHHPIKISASVQFKLIKGLWYISKIYLHLRMKE